MATRTSHPERLEDSAHGFAVLKGAASTKRSAPRTAATTASAIAGLLSTKVAEEQPSSVTKRELTQACPTPAAVIVACSDDPFPLEAVFHEVNDTVGVVRAPCCTMDDQTFEKTCTLLFKLGARSVLLLSHDECVAVRQQLLCWIKDHVSHGNSLLIPQAAAPPPPVVRSDMQPLMANGPDEGVQILPSCSSLFSCLAPRTADDGPAKGSPSSSQDGPAPLPAHAILVDAAIEQVVASRLEALARDPGAGARIITVYTPGLRRIRIEAPHAALRGTQSVVAGASQQAQASVMLQDNEESLHAVSDVAVKLAQSRLMKRLAKRLDQHFAAQVEVFALRCSMADKRVTRLRRAWYDRYCYYYE